MRLRIGMPELYLTPPSAHSRKRKSAVQTRTANQTSLRPMCGFSGFIDLAQGIPETNRADLAMQMANAIAHRGPDDADSWSDPSANYAVGFRRLSIIDLSVTGRQPMMTASGRFVIVFNGEVYNAPDLRRELERRGAIFRGYSDTEVVLNAFERWGIERSLHRFNGMFAIALWDLAERKLSLIRDRLGKKPLYYGQIGKTFFFGSQLKSFFCHPDWRAEIDRDSLAAYFRFGYVPCPHSIYKGIAKVRPAEWIEIHDGQVIGRKTYWNARERAANFSRSPLQLSDAAALTRLKGLLEDAVRERLISDVPLGAFLSGGIDSSTIVALMQTLSPNRVQTFSVGFEEPQYDESKYARAVAAHLGTEHHELRVSPKDSLEFIPKMPIYYDEPFADASQIPTCILSQFARGHVTVALSGDAGDELFAGYSRYQMIDTISKVANLLPDPVRKLTQRLLMSAPDAAFRVLEQFVPAKYGSSPLQSRARTLGALLNNNLEEGMFRAIVGQWNDPQLLVRGGCEPLDDLWGGAMRDKMNDVVQRMQFIDTMTYLPDDILVKVDRAGMSVGLEVRVPLTDYRLVEYSWQLPRRFKFRHGKQKWLLRELLRRYLPDTLIDRPKIGFMFPLAEWLRGPLRDWAENLLDAKRMESEGFLNPGPIREKWLQHLSGQANWQYRLWCVLMFQAWLRHWEHQVRSA
jgi:asparagine synthase (glutamine-hydrolysing)